MGYHFAFGVWRVEQFACVGHLVESDADDWVVESEWQRQVALTQVVKYENILALFNIQYEYLLCQFDFGKKNFNEEEAF